MDLGERIAFVEPVAEERENHHHERDLPLLAEGGHAAEGLPSRDPAGVVGRELGAIGGGPQAVPPAAPEPLPHQPIERPPIDPPPATHPALPRPLLPLPGPPHP